MGDDFNRGIGRGFPAPCIIAVAEPKGSQSCPAPSGSTTLRRLAPWKAWLGGLIIALGTLDYIFLDAGILDSEWPPMFMMLLRNSLLLLLIVVQLGDFLQAAKVQPKPEGYPGNLLADQPPAA